MDRAIPFTAADFPINDENVEGAELPISLFVMARECTKKLSAYGKTIKDATDFFIEHTAAGGKSATVENLVDELVAARQKAGASQFDVDDMRSRLAIFAKKFEARNLATITGEEIVCWLRSLNVSAVTRNHYRRLIVLAFNFAVQNGYVTGNPVFARYTTSGDVPGRSANHRRHLKLAARRPEVQRRDRFFSTADMEMVKD